jgi:hypothetical protein
MSTFQISGPRQYKNQPALVGITLGLPQTAGGCLVIPCFIEKAVNIWLFSNHPSNPPFV